jgi:hypothetical protein
MTEPINVNDMTFGVEIETTIPVGAVPVGGYHAGRQIEGLPAGWKAERDCSISCPVGHEACEVVSPILKGSDGIKQVKQVCDWLNAIGAKVNRSTGFHVHVGWSGDPEALKRLTHYVSNFEKALFASTGTHTREEGNFCRPIRESVDYTRRFRDGQAEGLPYNRYHVLNLTNLREGGRNTVEFRVFSGTTNATKALGYVRLCLGIVEKALKASRPPMWVGKKPVETSPIHRKGGEGQTELTRLMYGLGWTKGRESRAFGEIEAEGCPTVADSKAELMRLARKYDERQEEPQEPSGPRWARWDVNTWTAWESRLVRGQQVRIRLNDGTDCTGVFLRRYPRNLLIRVTNNGQPASILVARGSHAARSNNNGAFPIN